MLEEEQAGQNASADGRMRTARQKTENVTAAVDTPKLLKLVLEFG